MLDSLERLAALPGDTRVCCGHEYTLSNAAFARVVEPDNPALMRRIEDTQAMRQSGRPTLPSPLAVECANTPFLRIDVPAVRAATLAHPGQVAHDPVQAFRAVRPLTDGVPTYPRQS